VKPVLAAATEPLTNRAPVAKPPKVVKPKEPKEPKEVKAFSDFYQ
jgi:hypothetical protein